MNDIPEKNDVPTAVEPDMQEPDSLEPKDKNREFFRPFTHFLLVILGVLMLYSYEYPLRRTYESWNSDHGYNANGLWIFIGCMLLLFWIRKKLQKLPKKIDYVGLFFVVGALLWSLAFKRGDINAMQTIGFIGLVWAIFYYLGGWLMAKAVTFPLLLSLFTVQWGLGSSVVSLKMRVLSTQIACWFVNVTGAPFGIQVLRQGTNVSMVDLPDLAFDVAAACSGLQSLVMTSVLCLLMSYLMLKTWWKRLIMVLLIVPIAILNNSLRIVLIAYFGKFFTWIEHLLNLSPGWGKTIAFGAFHEYPGVFVYTMGFVMVWLAAHYLEKMPGIERDALLKRREEKLAKKAIKESAADDADDAETEAADSDEAVVEEPPKDFSYYGIVWKHVIVVIILVFAAYLAGKNVKQNIFYTKGLPSSQKYPTLVSGSEKLVQPLPYITNMPQRLSGYRRIAVPVSQEELRQLPDDTEYFRGMYVTEANFEKYNRALQATLSKATGTAAGYEIRYMAITNLFKEVPLTTGAVKRLVHSGAFYRTNLFEISGAGMEPLQQQRLQQQKYYIYQMLISQVVQQHRHPSNVMMAVVQNQTDRHSIHAPEACYPGQGWTIGKAETVYVPLANQKIKAACMDVGFKQESIRECVLYWYQCEGEQDGTLYATHNYPWLPFKTAFDLILKKRSDRWAFVRFSTSIAEGSTREDALGRLEKFVKLIEPYLIYPE
jgi:EpsI family protein